MVIWPQFRTIDVIAWKDRFVFHILCHGLYVTHFCSPKWQLDGRVEIQHHHQLQNINMLVSNICLRQKSRQMRCFAEFVEWIRSTSAFCCIRVRSVKSTANVARENGWWRAQTLRWPLARAKGVLLVKCNVIDNYCRLIITIQRLNDYEVHWHNDLLRQSQLKAKQSTTKSTAVKSQKHVHYYGL